MKRTILKIIVITAILLNSISPFLVFADENITGFDYENYWNVTAIVSTGQTLLTDYTPSRYTKFEFKGSFDSNSANGTLFGVIDSSNDSNNRWYITKSIANSNLQLKAGAHGFTISQSPGLALMEGWFASTGYNITWSGNTYSATDTQSSTVTNASRPLRIFGNNNAGSITNNNGSTLYYLFIYSNSSNTYLRKYYPAVRKSDNAVGFYETINGTFLTTTGLSYLGSTVTQYQITTSVSPSGSGTVTGGGTYDSGSVIQLLATANTGYSFLRWSDNDYSNPRTITVNSSQSYEAIFQQQSTPTTRYTISTSVSPSGSGTVSGGGTYDENTTVTLTATPNNGYEFVRWSDGVVSNPRSINVTSNLSITAEFTQYIPPDVYYTVSLSASNGGTVSGGGSYLAGSTATITAYADTGYVFAAWSDGSTANPRQLTVTSNVNLSALFTQDISNLIVIGTNLNIIDYENNRYNTSWYGTADMTTSNHYSIDLDDAGISYYSNYIFQFDAILNDDYYGSVSVSGFYLLGDGTTVNFSKTVYVNGNHFSFNVRSDQSAVTNLSFSYNTSNLIRKLNEAQLIQDGTQVSQEIANDMDDQNDQISSDIEDITAIETDYNDQMNSAINDIDFTSPLENTSILSTGTFIIRIFNGLVSDNPLSILIIIVCILIIGKRVIGK